MARLPKPLSNDEFRSLLEKRREEKLKVRQEKIETVSPSESTIVINPQTDGINHIRVHINGNTELGRALSFKYPRRIRHPEFGYFSSLYGMIGYVITKDEIFRRNAVPHSLLTENGNPDMVFEVHKHVAQVMSPEYVAQDKTLFNLLVNSELPFKEYYWPVNKSIFEPAIIDNSGKWYMNILTKTRDALKEKYSNT